MRALLLSSLLAMGCGSPAPDGSASPSPESAGPPAIAPLTSPSTSAPAAASHDPARPLSAVRGRDFACVLRANGRVVCWGNDEHGQLGLGHERAVAEPREVVGLDDAIALAAASTAACAVRREGSIVCWGSARDGELGVGVVGHTGGHLWPIAGVPRADAVFGGEATFCARTVDGTWCWGRVIEGSSIAWTQPPHRIEIEDVDRVAVGSRSFAFLRDGSALALEALRPPTRVEGLVDVASTFDGDFLAHADGEVTYVAWRLGVESAPTPVPALHGARRIAAAPYAAVGIDASGTLLVSPAGRATYESATGLAQLASGGGDLVAVTTDGRVLEWRIQQPTPHRAVHEIVLPPTGARPAPPALSEGRIPARCEVHVEVVRPVSFSGFLAMSGPYGDEREPPSGQDDARARICVSSGWSSPACDGPVWALDRDGSLGLAIPSADGSVRLLPGLALVSEGGTEEESSIEHADVRASPIEAFVELSEAEQSCEGEEGDETCGMSEARRRVVAVRELDGGAFVEVEIVVSPAQVRDDEPDPPPLEPPTLVVHGGEVTVHACGGARTFPLPADDTVDAGLDAGVDAGAPVPVPSETDVDAAIARCNVGWQHFGADEMDAARSDVEGGLVVLERADDERGRRARGACLYNLGRIEEAAGHTTEALALYRRSVAVRPNAAVQTRVESLGE